MEGWDSLFHQIAEEPYAKSLKAFLDDQYAHATVYPPRRNMFKAFELTPPSKVKVVILGQDPYHEPGQAMGLSFSVPRGTMLPPSLRNIYKEIEDDLGITMDEDNGDLTHWAEQGVLLLNAFLSVDAHAPLSHRNRGYEEFMAEVFAYLDQLPQPIVFLLWGGFARGFAKYLHNPNHLVLTAAHPSPLSANRGGFFGCAHFSKTNAFLIQHGVEPIQWQNKISLC